MISRTAFSLAVVSCLLACFAECASARTAAKPPNIVFILADDLGYGDLGCYGQTKIRTPNLDRLAAEGMRFTSHYSGSPVCAPSRAVLMTGKHPGHSWVRTNREVKPEGQFSLPENAVTLAGLLKKRGYRTGAFGKWGLGGPDAPGRPLKQGFDRFFGYNCQREAHTFYPETLWDNERTVSLDNPKKPRVTKLSDEADQHTTASYKAFSGKDYSADLIAEQALRFVRENRNAPFFLYWPTTVPHLALQVPEDSLAEYMGLWPDPPYTGGKGYVPQIAPRAAYAAMITRMDREIGRLLQLLDELELADDTIVVFTSDNGPTHGNLGGSDCEFFRSAGDLRGLKGSLYEGGIRVPLIVRWNGRIARGSVSGNVTGFEDWMPTLLELSDAPGSAGPGDGISFAPTLYGKKQPERPFLYREFPSYGGQQSLRAGDWKAVRQNLMPEKKGEQLEPTLELYNLKEDPSEQRNVAAQNPDVLAKLTAVMRAQHVPSEHFPFPALDEETTAAQTR